MHFIVFMMQFIKNDSVSVKKNSALLVGLIVGDVTIEEMNAGPYNLAFSRVASHLCNYSATDLIFPQKRSSRAVECEIKRTPEEAPEKSAIDVQYVETAKVSQENKSDSSIILFDSLINSLKSNPNIKCENDLLLIKKLPLIIFQAAAEEKEDYKNLLIVSACTADEVGTIVKNKSNYIELFDYANEFLGKPLDVYYSWVSLTNSGISGFLNKLKRDRI